MFFFFLPFPLPSPARTLSSSSSASLRPSSELRPAPAAADADQGVDVPLPPGELALLPRLNSARFCAWIDAAFVFDGRLGNAAVFFTTFTLVPPDPDARATYGAGAAATADRGADADAEPAQGVDDPPATREVEATACASDPGTRTEPADCALDSDGKCSRVALGFPARWPEDADAARSTFSQT